MLYTLKNAVAELAGGLAEAGTPRRPCAGACGNSQTRLSIASSFGAEDVVLIDVASRLGQPFRVFTLDTDFLFPETYSLIDAIEKRYGIKVERTHPELTPEAQAAKFGDALWAAATRPVLRHSQGRAAEEISRRLCKPG